LATSNGNETDHLKERLFQEPQTFELYQAIRLLERLMGPKTIISFRGNPSLAFPAAEIKDISVTYDDGVEIEVSIPALVGALGVLPRWYSELVLGRLRERDTSLAHFLDLFVNRLVRLRYETFVEFTPAILFERELRGQRPSRLTEVLSAAVGAPRDVPIFGLQTSACLKARRPLEAKAMQQVLQSWLGVPVAIREFTGRWYRVPDESQVMLSGDASNSSALGEAVVLGDVAFVPHAAITVDVGPVPLERVEAFMTDSSRFEQFRLLIGFLAGEAMDFGVDLIVEPPYSPLAVLGGCGQAEARLGLNTAFEGSEMWDRQRIRIWPIHNVERS
jgi:type VI secretion system protein ImpH